MAIADTITSMQNHTSNAYDMLSNGTDLTGINKNLQNLSSTIFEAFLEALRTPDTLFTNLPKTSGSGSQITLNDTANAPMRIELGASELSQAGTPTPSSPQDIHTISGSNKVVVCGKNILGWEYCLDNKAYNNDGELTTNNVCWAINKHQVIENNTITFSVNFTQQTGTQGRVIAFNSSGVKTEEFSITSFPTTITFGSNSKTYVYYFVKSLVPLNSQIQLEYGSTATTYEPYVSQEANINLDTLEYCKIGNYEDKFIRTSGKNLMYLNDIPYTETNKGVTYSCTNGILTINGTLTSGLLIDFTDFSLPAGNYYFYSWVDNATGSYARYFYDTTDTSYNKTNSGSVSISETHQVHFRFYANSGCVFNNAKIYCELVKGSQELPYEPYGTNEWYIKKNIGKVVLDGTESWVYQSSYSLTNTNQFAYTHAIETENTNDGLSNYFKLTTGWNTLTTIDEDMFQIYTDGAIYIRMNNTLASDLTTFKTWLSTHNTDIYYILETPTYTQITGTLAEQLENVYKKMLSYSGQTNISQVNNDLSFNLNVQAIEDLN